MPEDLRAKLKEYRDNLTRRADEAERETRVFEKHPDAPAGYIALGRERTLRGVIQYLSLLLESDGKTASQ